jgi:hypothetical protein
MTESQAEAAILSQERYLRPGRLFQPGEVSRAIRKAFGTNWQGTDAKGSSPAFKLPDQVNKTLQRQVIEANRHATVEALRRANPHPCDDLRPSEILPLLFPEDQRAGKDPLLCVSMEAKGESHTLPVSAHCHPLNQWHTNRASFLIPSAMTARTGKTQGGRASARSKENTGPRQHIIVECDGGESHDEQAAILNHLAGQFPLVMIVDSGGKSLHGWFNVRGLSESEVEKFAAYAASLGADNTPLKNPSQLVRMPNGYRRVSGGVAHDPIKQQVIYFNPLNPAKGPLVPNPNPNPNTSSR